MDRRRAGQRNADRRRFHSTVVGTGAVTYDRAYPFIDNRASRRSGKSATNRVADLSNPILQPWVREELRKVNQRALTEIQLWTPRSGAGRSAFPAGCSIRSGRFVSCKTEKQVVMIWEEDQMVRHVYLTPTGTPPNVKPSWFGESIGHYENGDTLVVDTIGLNTRTFVDSYQTPHTEQLHVVERYRIVEDGKALEVTARVEDPGAFTTPWTALQRYRRNDDAPLAEEVCAENNDKFFNYDNIEADPDSPQAGFLSAVTRFRCRPAARMERCLRRVMRGKPRPRLRRTRIAGPQSGPSIRATVSSIPCRLAHRVRLRRRNALRQVEHAARQRVEEGQHFGGLHHVGVLGVQCRTG